MQSFLQSILNWLFAQAILYYENKKKLIQPDVHYVLVFNPGFSSFRIAIARSYHESISTEYILSFYRVYNIIIPCKRPCYIEAALKLNNSILS